MSLFTGHLTWDSRFTLRHDFSLLLYSRHSLRITSLSLRPERPAVGGQPHPLFPGGNYLFIRIPVQRGIAVMSIYKIVKSPEYHEGVTIWSREGK
jgi:hypothetical protein